MATFNENTTIKISNQIQLSTASTGVNITYTTPADSYAIINYGATDPTAQILANINGINITGGTAVNNDKGGTNNFLIGPLHLGPGTTFTLQRNTGLGSIYIFGVEFVNSP